MFDGAQWEELSPARGEQMLAGLAPAPGAPDLDEDSDEDAEVRDDRDAADEAESSEPTASAARRPRVPGSAFATQHNKVMRNFAFRPGTTITNTTADADGDFGGPNTDPNELDDVKSRGRERKTLLKTVSVDISTVVGGKRANQFRDGWVLTFHKTQIKRGKKRVRADSGDHTGWIRVGDLSSRGIAAVAKYQQKMRKELGRGKGSGHKAKVRGPAKTIAPTNPASINGNAPRPADYFKFKVRGGSAETSLGNYTVNPKRYGSGVIIGVWNPPGSGADGKRFGGSGGVRAFVPIGTEIRLAATRALTIPDVTGTATATWRYVRVVLDNQPVYCWLLESWQTPKGSGSNF
ncbi:MAG TPA: hypothetical protein VIU61_13260 [Kofleriaceae bacterium]